MHYSTPSSQTSIPSIHTSTASNFTQRAIQIVQVSNYECTTFLDMDFDDSFNPSLHDSIHSMQTSLILPQTLSKPLYASAESSYELVSNQIASNRVQLSIPLFLPQFSSSHRTFDPVKRHFEFTGITSHTGPPTHAISNFVASLAVSSVAASWSLHCPRAGLGQGQLIFADPGPDPQGQGRARADPRASYI